MLACSLCQILWIVVTFFCAQVFMKVFTYILLLQMNGGQYNMTGWFISELYNPLPQIRIHYFNPLLN